MLDTIAESFQSALKPVTELYKLSAQFTSDAISRQTSLITETLSDTVSLLESISKEKDVSSALELQKGFAENLQQKLSEAGKSQLEEINSLKDKASVLVEEVVSQRKQTAESIYKAANDATSAFNKSA